MARKNMQHVAIMRKSWGLTQKILNGQKKIESRWYSVKYRPWNAIKKGETIYFKDAGEPVRIKAEVSNVSMDYGRGYCDGKETISAGSYWLSKSAIGNKDQHDTS
ncbi:MAG: hypothetical protein HYS52_00440 [Candidatus Wildermuthbacteria bacterium]|nr:hypothetical protein [Candidatus Wildermuthbacteria bacterium]